jgi:hypothetical protein
MRILFEALFFVIIIVVVVKLLFTTKPKEIDDETKNRPID